MRVQIVLVVLAAGVLHAVWNAIAKQLADQLIAFALIGVAATVLGGFALMATGLLYRTASRSRVSACRYWQPPG